MLRNKIIYTILILIIFISGCNFFSKEEKHSKLKKKISKHFVFKRKKKKINKSEKIVKQNIKSYKFVYNIENIKRNPFEPFIKKVEEPVIPERLVVTPLTEFSLNQYRFVAVITDKKPPLGMVETEDKRGLIFSIGDYIGNELYKVVKISSEKIVLMRKFYDYFRRLKTEKLIIKLDTTGE